MNNEIRIEGKSVTFPTTAKVKRFAKYLQLWFKPEHWSVEDKTITFLTDHWTDIVIFNFVKGFRNECYPKGIICGK